VSAPAMRQAFLDALGVKVTPTAAPHTLALQPNADSPELPLSSAELSALSIERLRLTGVHTQGDLVALSPEQLRNVSGLGKKKQKQILEFRQHLIGRGIKPTAQVAAQRRTLYPTLENDPSGACYAPSQGTYGSSCAGIRSFRWRPRRLLSGASSLQLQVLDFQKENEYGEVSLVDLGWRGKSASEPRDR
jgi:hypothetical protein